MGAAVMSDAVAEHGMPEIINSDQVSQFTGDVHRNLRMSGDACHEVRIIMDGKGRAIDNISIGRFWRTLKYDHIYLNPPTAGVDLHQCGAQFIHYYNHRRRHSSLDYVPPVQLLSMAA